MFKLPRCHKCNHRIFQNGGDGKIKIRTKIIVFSAQGTEIVCRKCGADIPVEIYLDKELLKGLLNPPKLVVRKKVDVGSLTQ
jgi:ribosomal protein S27E